MRKSPTALRRCGLGAAAGAIAACMAAEVAATESTAPRRIEEIVVYGQRVESTVSDTSISITAMDETFLANMGVQGPNEMINFIPATTRTDWDIKIRGIGTNFRGLGGDPGVGTYYNGIYSPDFGIAATENGLYDVERIEVLRGPQGTLYGRNSIGGVLNYVTNAPNHDEFEGQARVILGDYDTREVYGVVSGPLTESVAARLVATRRQSDGRITGMGQAEDVQDFNDQNLVLTLEWQPTDSITVSVRGNDRRYRGTANFGSGGAGILSEGPCIGDHPIKRVGECDPRYRVPRDTNYYAPGLRVVDASTPNAFPFVHPITGDTVYAYYNRPGVDPAAWPYSPSPNYMDPHVAKYNDGGDWKKPQLKSLTNNYVEEEFDHHAGSMIVDWDVSDRVSLSYLGDYQSFEYWFDNDNDASSSELSSMGDTVHADVWSWSHELRLFWELGDRWSATSGVYLFKEDRDQPYAHRNRLGKGYVNNQTSYGPAGAETWVRDAFPWLPDCIEWQTLPIGAAGAFGAYCGDPGRAHSRSNDTGAVYEQENTVVTENVALYTQGDLKLSDTFSVTLGLRYSEDDRQGLESRGGYDEIIFSSPDGDWVPFVLAGAAPPGFDASQFFAPGVTPLAAINVAMGAATFTGDPDSPIAPVCPLTAVTCDRPLRLGGLPISWGSRARGEYESDSWTYRVNFNWEPSEEILIYAGLTTGYRAGGFNMGGTDNRTDVDTDGDGFLDTTVLLFYDDEELEAYEVGYKGHHLNGRLQVAASLYTYNYENYQDNLSSWETSSGDFNLPPGVGAPPGRGPVEVTTNIPDVRNYGFEIDMTWLAGDRLTLGGNYGYTISEYRSDFTIFNQDDPRYPRTIMGGDVNEDPCTLPPQVKALYCVEVKGVQLSGIPKHKGVIWATYEWPIDAGTISLNASHAMTGEFFTSTFARPWDEVPASKRTDMRLTYRTPDRRWEASVFVDNVFDDRYLRWADMSNLATGLGSNYPHRGIALDPRFIGFEAIYSFGG